MRKLIFTALICLAPLPATRRNRAQERQPALLPGRRLAAPWVRWPRCRGRRTAQPRLLLRKQLVYDRAGPPLVRRCA
jgi:hypothetical protein